MKKPPLKGTIHGTIAFMIVNAELPMTYLTAVSTLQTMLKLIAEDVVVGKFC